MSEPNEDDVDLASLTETADALSRYAELVEHHGLESSEAKQFLLAHQHLPSFRELADEANRLESRFQKKLVAAGSSPRAVLGPSTAPSRWGAIAALAMIFLLAGGASMALNQSREYHAELKQSRMDKEKIGVAVISTLSEDIASSRNDPSAGGPIDGIEERRKMGEITAELKNEVRNNVGFFVDLASKKKDAKFAFETMDVISSVGKEIPASDIAGYKILVDLDRLVSAFPDDKNIQQGGGIAIKSLQARFPKQNEMAVSEVPAPLP